VQPVGAAKWPYNPALPSTYPYRNQDGADGYIPFEAVTEAIPTPSADQPEEVPCDELPGEADDQGPE
jgi:hypothetical protein